MTPTRDRASSATVAQSTRITSSQSSPPAFRASGATKRRNEPTSNAGAVQDYPTASAHRSKSTSPSGPQTASASTSPRMLIPDGATAAQQAYWIQNNIAFKPAGSSGSSSRPDLVPFQFSCDSHAIHCRAYRRNGCRFKARLPKECLPPSARTWKYQDLELRVPTHGRSCDSHIDVELPEWPPQEAVDERRRTSKKRRRAEDEVEEDDGDSDDVEEDNGDSDDETRDSVECDSSGGTSPPGSQFLSRARSDSSSSSDDSSPTARGQAGAWIDTRIDVRPVFEAFYSLLQAQTTPEAIDFTGSIGKVLKKVIKNLPPTRMRYSVPASAPQDTDRMELWMTTGDERKELAKQVVWTLPFNVFIDTVRDLVELTQMPLILRWPRAQASSAADRTGAHEDENEVEAEDRRMVPDGTFFWGFHPEPVMGFPTDINLLPNRQSSVDGPKWTRAFTQRKAPFTIFLEAVHRRMFKDPNSRGERGAYAWDLVEDTEGRRATEGRRFWKRVRWLPS